MATNILLGVTGSVAAIKTTDLVKALSAFGNVQIAATKAGSYFIDQLKLRDPVQPLAPVHTDQAEWPEVYNLGDPILHIELRRWASCLVIAPLDANTLAKLANGICDNLLTCVYRAWDFTRPVIVAPAMNTLMWEHPVTAKHLDAIESHSRNVHVIDPVCKKLACSDVGMGAMAPVDWIAQFVRNRIRWYFPLTRCPGIPINHHPGAFGFQRRKNHHTGVDLYASENQHVFAVEGGEVVHIEQFTGKDVGHKWWEDTWGVMVEGASGVVNYGELHKPSELKVGDRIHRGQKVGYVKRVLFEDRLRKDIPGHSTSMLHLELYKHGTRDFTDWHDPVKNPNLLDPTAMLLDAEGAPSSTLTWDNEEAKTVG